MKKQTKFFLLSLCIVTMALFQQCEKESPPPPIDYLPQEFLDWMYFKEGTWWVYQDSLRGGTDSVKVTESYFELNEVKIDGDVWDRFNQFTYIANSSSGETKTFIASDKCIGTTKSDSKNSDIDWTCYNVFYKEANVSLMFVGYPVGYRDSYTFVKARYDSLEVNNKLYYDVVLNYTPSQNNEGGIESWIYMAKGVGIIKERYIPQDYPEHIRVRELVDSHIVQ